MDKLDVRPVEHLVVVNLQRRPLGEDVIRQFGRRQRRHQVHLDRVRHPRAHLLGPKLVHERVGLLVVRHVRVVLVPDAEPAAADQPLPVRFALFGGGLECRLGGDGHGQEAADRLARLLEDGLQVGMPAKVFGLGDGPLSRRETEGRPPHEDGQGVGDLGDFLRDLHGRGAHAHQANALAMEVEVLGVKGGVVDLALVVLQAGKVGQVFLVQEARAQQEELGFRDAALVGLDCPLARLLVPGAALDPVLEVRVLAQVEGLVDVGKVAPEFAVVRESFAEGPGGVDLWDGELVKGEFRVDSGARVAIPVPRPSKAVPGLEDLGVEPQLAEAVEHGDAREACAYDDGIAADLGRCFRVTFVTRHVVSFRLVVSFFVWLEIDNGLYCVADIRKQSMFVVITMRTFSRNVRGK